MLIGYAWVLGDAGDDTEFRIIERRGCEQMFTDDYERVRRRGPRPGLAEAIRTADEGDTLVVRRLVRLGRSPPEILDVVADLHDRGIDLCALLDRIDTSSPSSDDVFRALGANLRKTPASGSSRRRSPKAAACAWPRRTGSCSHPVSRRLHRQRP